MNRSIFVSLSEIDFLWVGCSNPSDLTSKGLVERSSIFNFVKNSAFLQKLRRKLNLLELFLNVHLILGFGWHFRRLECGRRLIFNLPWNLITINVCVSLQVNLNRLLHDRLNQRLLLWWWLKMGREVLLALFIRICSAPSRYIDRCCTKEWLALFWWDILSELLWKLGPWSLLAEIVVQVLGLGSLIWGPGGLWLDLLLLDELLVGWLLLNLQVRSWVWSPGLGPLLRGRVSDLRCVDRLSGRLPDGLIGLRWRA